MQVKTVWIVNQFANTPDLPGHTRQFEVAAGLVDCRWSVDIFASDFNLAQRQYRRLRFPALWRTERPAGIRWTWLWPCLQTQQLEAPAQHAELCLHLVIRLAPVAPGRLVGRSPDVILASSQLPAAFTCLDRSPDGHSLCTRGSRSLASGVG